MIDIVRYTKYIKATTDMLLKSCLVRKIQIEMSKNINFEYKKKMRNLISKCFAVLLFRPVEDANFFL